MKVNGGLTGCTLDSYYDEDKDEIVYKASTTQVYLRRKHGGIHCKGALEGLELDNSTI